MKNITITVILLYCCTLQAQIENDTTKKEKTLYGEISFGGGQTLFFKGAKANLSNALGGSFDPVVAGNLSTAFYYAPKNWKGFGVGTRFSWSGGPGSVGDKNEDYFFNYYNFSASLKYYFFSNTFNNGFYLRSSIGTGQLTSKRANDLEKSYTHQFAIGTTLTGNIGYTIPLNEIKSAQALSLELHFETSNRNGTIDGIGDKTFKTGQIGANVIFSF